MGIVGRLGQAPSVSVRIYDPGELGTRNADLSDVALAKSERQTSNAKRPYSLGSVPLDSGAQISGTDGIPASPHRFCSMMPLAIPSAIRWR